MSEVKYQPIAAATAIEDENASKYHLNWLLVDAENNWIDASVITNLPALDLSLRFGYLVIRAPGMLRLDIPLDVIEDDTSVELTANINGQNIRAVDEGDLAGAWFTEWAGRPCKLVKVHPESDAINWD